MRIAGTVIRLSVRIKAPPRSKIRVRPQGIGRVFPAKEPQHIQKHKTHRIRAAMEPSCEGLARCAHFGFEPYRRRVAASPGRVAISPLHHENLRTCSR